MTTVTTDYELRRTGPTIGTEVVGLRLADGVDEETRAVLNREFLERKVVVFRDQHLTPDQHVEAASIFGTPFDHPTAVRHDDNRLVYPYDSQRDGKATTWHIGGLWRTPPFSIESLTYQVIPPLAGGTQWADLQAAYDDLSDRFKALIDGLGAEYDADPVHYAQGADRRAAARQTVEHPLVLTHPETGRQGLFLSSSAIRVSGVPEREGRWILEHLFAHASAPRYSIRYSWNAGDFALRDNRATWHSAVDDYGDAPRAYRKVIVDRA